MQDLKYLQVHKIDKYFLPIILYLCSIPIQICEAYAVDLFCLRNTLLKHKHQLFETSAVKAKSF